MGNGLNTVCFQEANITNHLPPARRRVASAPLFAGYPQVHIHARDSFLTYARVWLCTLWITCKNGVEQITRTGEKRWTL